MRQFPSKLLCFVSLLLLNYTMSVAKDPVNVNYELTCDARPYAVFNDVTYGLTLTVNSDVTNSEILDFSQLTKKELKAAAKVNITFSPTIREFVEQSLSKFVRASGISLNKDRYTDFNLKVVVREFKFTDASPAVNAYASVVLDYTLLDAQNKVVIQRMARGKSGFSGTIPQTIDKAYTKALEEIDWDGISNALTDKTTERNKRADQETDKQVVGDGDTALEHTIIRWYIASNPAGADVSWRVVSSTPDVKNTNSNYVGTTPYETTESFDIRGLKYDNSGNIQIEVTCEKAGYITQKKRFNVRQAIDQKEISAKFNLVKEDSE